MSHRPVFATLRDRIQPYHALRDHTPLAHVISQGAAHDFTHVVEEPKIAVEQDRGSVILRHSLHVIPTLISIGVLSLSLAEVYFCDLGFQGLNSILKGFQFAAKFHEILLTASLSAIVLHRIRYELAAANGVHFGFITSGYQLSSVSYLFTSAFWSAAMAQRRYKSTVRVPLACLLMVAIALTALAGPSSAIAMIPELEWWPYPNAFSGTKGLTFINRAYTDLWPPVISASMVADCSTNSQKFAVEYSSSCPSSGFRDIYDWASGYMNQQVLPNITRLNDGEVSRYLSATPPNVTGGWSVASTVNTRTAKTLGSLWEYVGKFGLGASKIGRPIFIPSMTNGPIMKPLVQVQCGQTYDANQTSTITFPYDQLVGKTADAVQPQEWTIQTPTSDFSEGLVMFEWVDLPEQATPFPVIGALFRFSTKAVAHTMLPCTVTASWVPVKTWLDPRIDSTVLQDSSDPLTIVSDPLSMLQSQPITIQRDWADLLNAPSGTTLWVTQYNLSIIEAEVAAYGYPDADGFWRIQPPGYIPWLFATPLSLQIADGLAEFSSVHNSCSAYIYNYNRTHPSNSYTLLLDDVDLESNITWYPPDEPFDVVARRNTSQWTEIEWEVLRFGYGWGFNGITIYFAATILLLHAVLAIIHVLFALSQKWATNSWTSTMELLALAMNSTPTQRLSNTSAGIRKSATWKEIVRIREVGDTKLQLVFDDAGMGEKPKLGKKYQ
jgi:hypothetical protein